MKKRIMAAMLCVICVFGLWGCSLMTKKYGFVIEENSIYVHSDGQITAAIIEEFDKDYYDLQELVGLTQSLVQDYNETYYGLPYYTYEQLTKEQKKQLLLPISLESASAEDGKVVLVLKYANGNTYTDFNGIDIAAAGGTKAYTSPVGESSAMALDGTFVAAKGGEVQLTEELQKKTGYYMIYVDFGTKIYFEHEVAYVTNNVTVLGDNSVQTPAGQGSFILFK